ncbi:dTDP-glucose 4,6-dehydratase [Candidatus Peregrinibacteria bacterium]|nr:MAG: dTDP-glucose 4,6-dehydratase [Candidatus Peregrinibacteria bacterium]
MHKNLLITGGCGFIGSHFVLEAHKRGYNIINLDALTYAANKKHLSSIDQTDAYTFIHGDIRDKDFLETHVFEKYDIDGVVHFAAETHVDKSITNPSLFIETNVLGTQNLLFLSRKYNIKRYLQVSTDEVYGDLKLEDDAFSETTPIQPHSPYSASKAGADHIVQAYHDTYGFPTLITRCSNNYGPHQDSSKFLPVIIQKALNNESIPVYGEGKQIRDWLYVTDHVDGIFRVFEEGKAGEVYNIGGGVELTNIQLVKYVLKSLGKSESLITFVADRPGHDFRYAIDMTKIETELGWTPKFTFEQGIDNAIAWFSNNNT